MMGATTADFDKAADSVKEFKVKPNNDELLKLYGLFKQATVGDVNTDRPGFLDQKGRAKWDAWSTLKTKSQDNAKTEYITLVDSLKQKYQQ